MSGDTRETSGAEEGLAVARARPKLERPQLYRVLLLNDDYTPMEYVVVVLEQFFGKRREEAVNIMLHVHQKGLGVCGVFSREIAETKVRQVLQHAREHRHPLQCTMEAE
jgi:ATP-dependent Clp protease adaptor protein ClpS